MHKILVIRLYFPLGALHVSDYISPSSGATFISCTSYLVYAGVCWYHTSAPDDGLIYVEHLMENIKSNHKNVVHLVAIYT